MAESALHELWRYATEARVPKRSVRVAVVVGTLLNLINQGDAILGAGAVVWRKLILTYTVPDRVATYGAVSARRAMERLRR